MADETPKPKRTIPLPPKKDDPKPAPKEETLDEKIARLEKEAKLAALEKEAAKRAKAPVTTRTKEAISTGISKTGGGIAKGAKFTGEKLAIPLPGQDTYTVRNPVTGRMEAAPTIFEKGIQSLSEIGGWMASKTKKALVGQTAEEKLRGQLSPEELNKVQGEEARKSAIIRNRVREQALELGKPSSNLDVGPDKKVVVGPRGQQAVVPKNIPNVAVLEPLESRIASYTERLHNFIKNESPVFSTGMRKTYPAAFLTASRNKISRIAGSQIAEDFLIAGLNKSGMFSADEVPAVAARLKNRLETRKLLTDSGLFDAVDRPKTRISGGAPKPIDGGGTKFTAIQDDFGNEVKVTPEGRTSWASPAKEPTLDEKLAKFKGKKAETLKAAELARQAELEDARRAVAPYGETTESGQAARTFTGPNSQERQAVLRTKIDKTNAEREAARIAEQERARIAAQQTRARVETANNAAEQAFLKRLEAQRQATTAQRGVEADATWDFRTPRELAMPMASAASGLTGDAPTGVTRMDRLRNIATLNTQTPEEYALQKWLRSRAPLNNVSTEGGTPLRGIVAGRNPNALNLRSTLGSAGQVFGMAPDILTGYALGVQGSGMTSDGRILYPHEMTTIDGTTYANDTIDTMTAMHPNNAARHPEITHAQRYNFNPRWYRDYEDARSQDVAEWVKRTGYVAKPMQGSEPISPEVLNAIRAAQ